MMNHGLMCFTENMKNNLTKTYKTQMYLVGFKYQPKKEAKHNPSTTEKIEVVYVPKDQHNFMPGLLYTNYRNSLM